MREAERVEHIDRLIRGIEIIGPGAIFERFGAKFLDHHLDVDLVHRGLNAQLNPVAGTVDSVDDASVIAAEYSIVKDYFQAQWAKPTNDLLHVLNAHPKVEHIYLLASQTSTPADIAAAKARVGQWPGFQGRTIHYYDARRIAEVIVDDMLLQDTAVGALVEHLPVLERILNEVRATLAIPSVDPQRVPFPDVDAAIDGRLSDVAPVVALAGLPGSGKSDAAAAYLASRSVKYQTLIWVEGGNLRNVAELSSQRLWRGGADMNVGGLLAYRRCLAVIDDLPPEILVADLKLLCGPGSRIIVTRRQPDHDDIILPDLTPTQARSVLDRDIDEPCPEVVLTALMSAVGGHPQSLALLNKAVRNGVTWQDISDNCQNVAEYADGRRRLADYVLDRLQPLLIAELTVFDWAGQSSCDARLLKALIRSPGIAKLGGQGLRAADRPAVFRLHDVVYASLRVQDWLTPERSAVLDKAFNEHLAVLASEESLALRVLAASMRGKLETLASQKRSPGVLLALLSLWRADELDLAAVGQPEDYVAELEARGDAATYVEFRFALESIEGLYRYGKAASKEAAQQKLRDRLSLFPRLLNITTVDTRSHAEVRHHWGKALKVLDLRDEAAAQFEEVMAAMPLNATKLQLVRLYARDNERAVALADEILTAAKTPLTVISSVVLGVVEDLSWAKGSALHALFDKHADLIEREIIEAADVGYEQAYAALASVGRYWAWHDPIRLQRLVDSVPVLAAGATDDRTAGALGEISLKLAKAAYPPNKDLQEKAVSYFRGIAKPDSFQLQKLGEVLIDLGRYSEAESTLRQIENYEADPFASYRLSQARLHQGDIKEARALADTAINSLGDKGAKFASSFLAHRYRVRHSQGDPAAVSDLDDAISLCEPGKYRDFLKNERRKAT